MKKCKCIFVEDYFFTIYMSFVTLRLRKLYKRLSHIIFPEFYFRNNLKILILLVVNFYKYGIIVIGFQIKVNIKYCKTHARVYITFSNNVIFMFNKSEISEKNLWSNLCSSNRMWQKYLLLAQQPLNRNKVSFLSIYIWDLFTSL